ncbi:MAG: hypothetical protein N3A66_05470, partial [Planctomycetota bacterium]|nr:hypothetical protein [Planctomycetota bacterium]
WSADSDSKYSVNTNGYLYAGVARCMASGFRDLPPRKRARVITEGKWTPWRVQSSSSSQVIGAFARHKYGDTYWFT